jgi:DNA polymerase-3 subunit gamma/tau
LPENLYRKWRPAAFAELAGQEHIAITLRKALASGRTTHAYLFCGPRGTGKTTSGRLLAKAINCTDRRDGEPCNQCASCLSFIEGRAIDLIELDAASNRGIDEIRSLRDKVAFHPASGEFKVYLIDEVHMLTEPAFNALLKTLEEPPPHVVFILATTEAHKVPATILSRCQRYDFHRVPLDAALRRLEEIAAAEGVIAEPAALELIARSATGSMRDAVNLLDQMATSFGGQVSLDNVRAALGLIGDGRAGQLARAAVSGDLAGGLALIGNVRDDGLDLRQFQREVVQELRTLLLVQSGVEPPDGMTAEARAETTAFLRGVQPAAVLGALRAFGAADLKADPSSSLPLDIALADSVLSIGAAPPAPAAETPRAAPATPTPPAARPAATPSAPEPKRAAPAAVREPSRPPPAPPSPPPVDEAPSEMPPSSPPAADPTPASSPRSDRPAAAVGSLAAARELMPRVYALARKRTPQAGALLNSGCDIIEAGETEWVFGFMYPNLAENMKKPANLDVLREVVNEALGREVAVRVVHDGAVTDWRRRSAKSPLVRAAQEMGARVVAAKDED